MNVPPLARRAIEWRHGWPVRFAHHPLCARHRHETWRIGGAYMCRGCVSLFAGLACGGASVVVAGGPSTALFAGLLAPFVLLLSWPRWYPRIPRAVRDLARFSLGLVIVLGSHAIASAPSARWPLLVLGVALWALYRSQRRRVNARRCDGCPELGRGVCSGFAPHARAMRAIAEHLEAHMGHPAAAYNQFRNASAAGVSARPRGHAT